MYRRGLALAAMVAVAVALPSAQARPPSAPCRNPDIVGTRHSEVILGTWGNDTIRSRKGDDTVFSLGGNDVLCGGLGADRLLTGTGHDFARGGPGVDECDGEQRESCERLTRGRP
jgi:hypothetical protein